MLLYQRLIYKTLVKATLICTLLLAGIDIFFNLLGELDDIGKAHYTLSHAVHYVLWMLPGHLYTFFPMVALIGAMAGLHILISSRELMMIQLYGRSLKQIACDVFLFALVVGFAVSVTGELIVPYANQTGTMMRAVAKSDGQAYKSAAGLWLRNKDQFLHIRDVLPHGHVEGVTIYQFDSQHQLQTVSQAHDAKFVDNVWHLYDVKKTRIAAQQTTVEQQSELLWPVKINPGLFSLAMLTADDVSVVGLVRTMDYLKRNHQAFGEYAYSLYKRLIQPLAIMVMVILAVPFVLGPLQRFKRSINLLMGFGLGFAFYLCNRFAIGLNSQWHWPAALCVILPVVLFAGGGWMLFRRIEQS